MTLFAVFTRKWLERKFLQKKFKPNQAKNKQYTVFPIRIVNAIKSNFSRKLVLMIQFNREQIKILINMVKFPSTENNYFTVSVSVEEKTEQIDNIPNFILNISYFLGV